MDDFNDIKYVMKYDTGITVSVYKPRNIHEYIQLAEFIINSYTESTYHVEVSFEDWEDPMYNKIGMIMITPSIYLTIEDFEFFVNNLENYDGVANICGKDKLYIDTSTGITGPFAEYKDLKEEMKNITGCDYDTMDEKIKSRLKTSGESTFDILHIINNKESLKRVMFVILCKVYSYYNMQNKEYDFFRNACDTGMVDFLNGKRFYMVPFNGMHQPSVVIREKQSRDFNNILNYLKDLIHKFENSEHILVVDVMTCTYILSNEMKEKYKGSFIMKTVYKDKEFLYVMNREQIDRLKESIEHSKPEYPSHRIHEHILSIPLLFDKEMDGIYKRSLLRSGCSGYDAVYVKDVS